MEEIKTRPLISVRASAPLIEAARMIADFSIGALGVTDAEGSFEGLLTERDLAWAIAQGKDPVRTQVGEVVNDLPIVIHEPMDLREAAERLTKAHVRHLLFLRGGEYRIISARDILRELVGAAASPQSGQELRRWFGIQPISPD